MAGHTRQRHRHRRPARPRLGHDERRRELALPVHRVRVVEILERDGDPCASASPRTPTPSTTARSGAGSPSARRTRRAHELALARRDRPVRVHVDRLAFDPVAERHARCAGASASAMKPRCAGRRRAGAPTTSTATRASRCTPSSSGWRPRTTPAARLTYSRPEGRPRPPSGAIDRKECHAHGHSYAAVRLDRPGPRAEFEEAFAVVRRRVATVTGHIRDELLRQRDAPGRYVLVSDGTAASSAELVAQPGARRDDGTRATVRRPPQRRPLLRPQGRVSRGHEADRPQRAQAPHPLDPNIGEIERWTHDAVSQLLGRAFAPLLEETAHRDGLEGGARPRRACVSRRRVSEQRVHPAGGSRRDPPGRHLPLRAACEGLTSQAHRRRAARLVLGRRRPALVPQQAAARHDQRRRRRSRAGAHRLHDQAGRHRPDRHGLGLALARSVVLRHPSGDGPRRYPDAGRARRTGHRHRHQRIRPAIGRDDRGVRDDRRPERAVAMPHVRARSRVPAHRTDGRASHRIPVDHGFTVACFPIRLDDAGAGWVRLVAIVHD